MRRSAAEIVLITVCLAALATGFAIGGRWPLVGDSVLMHYVVLLTRHGFAPYRDVAEMNLPLTYMSEGAAMRIFGMGAFGWRLYDGCLVLAIVACCWHLLRRRGAAAGLFAAALFATVHLQDGIHMAGQRDLLVTLLQAAAGCVLLGATPGEAGGAARRRLFVPWSAFALFGLLSTAAACIKPPAILFAVLGLSWFRFKRPVTEAERDSNAGLFAAAIAGACIPVLLCLGYLLHFGALGAFMQDVHGLIAYHASLERRSIGFLFGHIWSPVLPLVLLTVIASVVSPRARWSGHDTFFALSAAAGLVSYLVQGKGFPYQRYPFLLWILLLCASRLWMLWQRPNDALDRSNDEAQSPMRIGGAVAVFAAGAGVALMAMFLLRAARFSHADPYLQLRQDLVAHNALLLNGRLQCLDTAGPCIGAMYESRLTQSTGFLYDCYLLDGQNAVVRQQRDLFEREWQAWPPQMLILTDSNCFTAPRTFDKYNTWPWMQQQLADFEPVLERHPNQPLHLWSRLEQPYAYRILLRR